MAVACVVSAVLSWLIVASIRGAIGFPASVFALDAVFAFVLVGGSRLAFRGFVEWRGGRSVEGDLSRVLVVGAGTLGRSFAREVRETPGQRIVGFVDDNPTLRGRRIAGQRVLGPLAEVERAVAESGATEVVVTIEDVSAERLELVGAGCTRAGVPCTVMRRRMEPVLESAERPPSEPSYAPAREAGVDPSAPPLCRHGRARDLADAPASYADDLLRRARDDAARPVARGHGSRHPARDVAQGARPARRLRERAVLVDRQRAERVCLDQDGERARDGARRLPHVRARACRRLATLGALRGGRHRARARPRVCAHPRQGADRLSRLGAGPVPDHPLDRAPPLVGSRARDRGQPPRRRRQGAAAGPVPDPCDRSAVGPVAHRAGDRVPPYVVHVGLGRRHRADSWCPRAPERVSVAPIQ